MLKSSNFLTILPFMVQDLGLSGSALITYAVIHSFSQDGESRFYGSVEYISEWAGADERTIRNNLAALEDRGLITIQKRPGHTSAYRTLLQKPPVENSGTPEKTSGVPWKKLPDTPEKTSGDRIPVRIPEKQKEKDPENLVFKNEPAKTKEDAVVVFNRIREFSNNQKIFPECRDLVIPPAHYEILPTLQNYAETEAINALKNFHWHNTGRCGPGWKPPPQFRSLYGFLKTGVEQYCNDEMVIFLFKEAKHGVER
jgi:hypothetical protein